MTEPGHPPPHSSRQARTRAEAILGAAAGPARNRPKVVVVQGVAGWAWFLPSKPSIPAHATIMECRKGGEDEGRTCRPGVLRPGVPIRPAAELARPAEGRADDRSRLAPSPA